MRLSLRRFGTLGGTITPTFENGLVSNGMVGIGTTPTTPLHIVKAWGALSAAQTGVTQTITITGSGNAAGNSGMRAMTFSITGSGSNSLAEVSAITGDSIVATSAGTTTTHALMSANLRISGAGTVGTAYGYRVIPLLSSSGGATAYVAFEARTPSCTSTGVITTATGILINAQATTGVTNGRGIWQTGASDLNSFAGLAGFGAVTAPTATVHTGASTTARASLCLPHGTAPTSPVNGDVWTTTAGLFVRVNGSTVGPLT